MKKKIRIGIVFGGRSGEHEVSLKSAQSVIKALDKSRYDVTLIGISKEGFWMPGPQSLTKLKMAARQDLLDNFNVKHLNTTVANNSLSANPASIPPVTSIIPHSETLEPLDVVFPILHGPFGEDGTIQGLLEMAQVAYVGCGVLASSAGMDKILFKDVMVAHNIPSVPYLPVARNNIRKNPDKISTQIIKSIGFPVFVKPANLGSSVGISMCNNKNELIKSLQYAAKFDHRLIIEKAIVNAREIEISVLGNDNPLTSVPGEIIPSREFYDYEAKYIDDGDEGSRLIIPADLTELQIDSVKKYAIQAFRAIDGTGMSRVDFLLDNESGDIYLNELNTIPGFTSISMYAKLWEASGVSYSKLIDTLIELALERFKDRQSNLTEYIPKQNI